MGASEMETVRPLGQAHLWQLLVYSVGVFGRVMCVQRAFSIHLIREPTDMVPRQLSSFGIMSAHLLSSHL